MNSQWSIASVEALLSQGGAVDRFDGVGRTPLLAMAGSTGDPAALVRTLLGAGADPHSRGKGIWPTPLFEAVQADNAEIVALLIAAGAEVGARWGRMTPLSRARSARVVRALLAAGAITDPAAGAEALCALAAADRDGEMVGALLAAGLSPNCAEPGSPQPRSALEMAILHGPGDDAALRLIAAGADPNRRTTDDRTLLVAALTRGRVRAARALLRAGAEAEGLRGYDRALLAVLSGDAEALEKVLDKAPKRPKERPFAVTTAAQLGEPALLRRLIAVEGVQWNTLEAAVEGGDPACFGVLIEAGAAAGAELLLARLIKEGRWELADRLIAAGTPIAWALRHVLDHDWASLDRVLAGRSALGERDRPHFWSLEQVILRGDLALLSRLAALGAELHQRDDKGRSLMDVAIAAGQEPIVTWLGAHGLQPAEDRTGAVRARWKARLAAHRRSWPEWARLEQLADSPNLSAFIKRSSDWLRLPGGLSVRVAETEALSPPWLSPLDHLGPDPDCGAIANSASGPLPRGMVGDLFPYTGVEIPRDLEMLQFTPQGSLLCIDRMGQVVGWQPSARTFSVIGPLEPFVRFCLACALDGRDWYRDLRGGVEGLAWFDMPD